MLHNIVQIVSDIYGLAGTYLRHELGTSDYRIVRLVFFSAMAAWSVFAIPKVASSIIYVVCRLIFTLLGYLNPVRLLTLLETQNINKSYV